MMMDYLINRERDSLWNDPSRHVLKNKKKNEYPFHCCDKGKDEDVDLWNFLKYKNDGFFFDSEEEKCIAEVTPRGEAVGIAAGAARRVGSLLGTSKRKRMHVESGDGVVNLLQSYTPDGRNHGLTHIDSLEDPPRGSATQSVKSSTPFEASPGSPADDKKNEQKSEPKDALDSVWKKLRTGHLDSLDESPHASGYAVLPTGRVDPSEENDGARSQREKDGGDVATTATTMLPLLQIEKHAEVEAFSDDPPVSGIEWSTFVGADKLVELPKRWQARSCMAEGNDCSGGDGAGNSSNGGGAGNSSNGGGAGNSSNGGGVGNSSNGGGAGNSLNGGGNAGGSSGDDGKGNGNRGNGHMDGGHQGDDQQEDDDEKKNEQKKRKNGEDTIQGGITNGDNAPNMGGDPKMNYLPNGNGMVNGGLGIGGMGSGSPYDSGHNELIDQDRVVANGQRKMPAGGNYSNSSSSMSKVESSPVNFSLPNKIPLQSLGGVSGNGSHMNGAKLSAEGGSVKNGTTLAGNKNVGMNSLSGAMGSANMSFPKNKPFMANPQMGFVSNANGGGVKGSRMSNIGDMGRINGPNFKDMNDECSPESKKKDTGKKEMMEGPLKNSDMNNYPNSAIAMGSNNVNMFPPHGMDSANSFLNSSMGRMNSLNAMKGIGNQFNAMNVPPMMGGAGGNSYSLHVPPPHPYAGMNLMNSMGMMGSGVGNAAGIGGGFLPGGPMNEMHAGVMGGLASGMSNGLASGMSNGLASGMSNGLASGMSNGLASGMSNGLASGMSNGLTSGMINSLVSGPHGSAPLVNSPSRASSATQAVGPKGTRNVSTKSVGGNGVEAESGKKNSDTHSNSRGVNKMNSNNESNKNGIKNIRMEDLTFSESVYLKNVDGLDLSKNFVNGKYCSKLPSNEKIYNIVNYIVENSLVDYLLDFYNNESLIYNEKSELSDGNSGVDSGPRGDELKGVTKDEQEAEKESSLNVKEEIGEDNKAEVCEGGDALNDDNAKETVKKQDEGVTDEGVAEERNADERDADGVTPTGEDSTPEKPLEGQTGKEHGCVVAPDEQLKGESTPSQANKKNVPSENSSGNNRNEDKVEVKETPSKGETAAINGNSGNGISGHDGGSVQREADESNKFILTEITKSICSIINLQQLMPVNNRLSNPNLIYDPNYDTIYSKWKMFLRKEQSSGNVISMCFSRDFLHTVLLCNYVTIIEDLKKTAVKKKIKYFF